MEIKYEAVFGDQGIFDKAPKEATHATQGGGFYKVNDDGLMEYLSNGVLNGNKNEFLAAYLIAERRIIRTPTWTAADQKAGKLPEVGCRVNFCHKLNTNWRTGEIKYIDDQVTVIKADDILRLFVYEIERVEFKPIESPEEKAARLREEWVSTATFMTTYEIYDQLLSGDLPVPVKE